MTYEQIVASAEVQVAARHMAIMCRNFGRLSPQGRQSIQSYWRAYYSAQRDGQ